MAATATALPFGEDGHECFVRKGSCRKCGSIAFGKRKCQQCYRKYCAGCAPESLQKYGEECWEECCIGCEPFLVVAPANSEPIFELEPESEDVVSHSSLNSKGRGPIHVPLSATYASEDSRTDTNYLGKQSAPVSSSTFSTDSESNDSAGGSAADSLSTQSACCASCQATISGGRVCPACGTEYCGDCSSQEELPFDSNGTCRSCSILPQQTPMTPTTTRQTMSACFDALEPPTTPDSGCCTACQTYSTGKQPCSTCGTKYCRETRCHTYLYEDGSCAKCRITPRTAILPELPVDVGCCMACQQYANGKKPCETCGTKYCQESACQAYLFSNGTCAVCHGSL